MSVEKSNGERRKSSTSNLDKEKLAKLQQLRVFQKSGGIASKLLRIKAAATADESAAAAISLSKVMARKKGAELSLQIEIETEAHWKLLLRKEGLIVVEVYAGWCGPCLTMVNILKKVKVDANDDRLTLATVNSDNIPDLRVFRGQSEPAWIFIGGGKPVKLMKGANAAELVATIKSEFQHELLCMEGKVKRNLISIKDEAERRHKAQSEAIQLITLAQKKEAEAAAALMKGPPTVEQGPTTTTTTAPVQSVSPVPGEEISQASEITAAESDTTIMDYLEDPGAISARMEKTARESAEEGINTRLATALESLTVLAIQGFLLETGAVTEIKDLLMDEFQITKERYIFLDEAGVRELFGIPYSVEELVEEEEPSELVVSPITNEEELEEQDSASVITMITETAAGDKLEGEEGERGLEGEEEEERRVEVVKMPKYVTVPVPMPEELVGDTLLFLLESVEVVKQKEQDPDATLAKTADDILRFRVGPSTYQEAVDNEPKSLLAIYGREEYAQGVWCPKTFEDKKYVMLHYFPEIVTELLMPPQKELPKYMLAIFPALFSHEIMEQPELLTHETDVLAQGNTSLPPKLLDRILKSRGLCGEDLEAQKKALTGYHMFILSIDGRNEDLVTAVLSMEPLHYSTNAENGRFETAKLFPYLNILIDEDYEEEIYTRDSIIEKFLSRPKLKLQAILDDDNFEDNGED